MNIQQLKNYWQENDEPLYLYSSSKIDKTKIDNDTFIFFTSCGLPSDAAPSLSFNLIKENRLLTPNQIFRIDFKGLENYLMFGSNGMGDPICVDTKNNEIVYLNHDKYFERIFINKTIFQFAACLTKYRDFIFSLINKTNYNFSKRKFTDSEFETLKNEMKAVDNSCLENNNFWLLELDYLIWENENP